MEKSDYKGKSIILPHFLTTPLYISFISMLSSVMAGYCLLSTVLGAWDKSATKWALSQGLLKILRSAETEILRVVFSEE